MRMRDFIRQNRQQLDDTINSVLGECLVPLPRRNDQERELWIQNDEGLYNWAKREGVQV